VTQDLRDRVLRGINWMKGAGRSSFGHVAYPSPASGARVTIGFDTKGTPPFFQLTPVHNIWSYLPVHNGVRYTPATRPAVPGQRKEDRAPRWISGPSPLLNVVAGASCARHQAPRSAAGGESGRSLARRAGSSAERGAQSAPATGLLPLDAAARGPECGRAERATLPARRCQTHGATRTRRSSRSLLREERPLRVPPRADHHRPHPRSRSGRARCCRAHETLYVWHPLPEPLLGSPRRRRGQALLVQRAARSNGVRRDAR